VEFLVSIILVSGRTALEMAIYLLIPVLVVMLSVMKLLEAKGVLAWVSNKLAPVSSIFGIPGLGVFAMVKLMFVSFAAPIATLSIMDKGPTVRRQIAATLAMLLVMSQANVVYPLVVVGLNASFIYLSSLAGGLFAAAVTYYLVFKSDDSHEIANDTSMMSFGPDAKDKKTIIQILSEGGQEGLQLVFSMVPLLILSLCVVNLLDAFGVIDLIIPLLTPFLSLIGLPDSVVLPLVTKFIAGGTAFVGVTIDLMNQGVLTAQELNRMAGIALNPFDVVGVALLLTAGKRVQSVVKPAIIGAISGIVLRAVIHLIAF